MYGSVIDILNCIQCRYSLTKNNSDFSFHDTKNSIFMGNINAHSPKWGCGDVSSTGEEVEDLLLIYYGYGTVRKAIASHSIILYFLSIPVCFTDIRCRYLFSIKKKKI